MKSVKAKLIISNTLLIVVVLLLVGTTIAYFSDHAAITNTMTSGNVSIKLSEAQVKADGSGNLVIDSDKPRFFSSKDTAIRDYGTIFPGQTVYKDPTVHCTGTEASWMAAKITLFDGNCDIKKVIGSSSDDGIELSKILSGALFDERVTVGEWNGYQNVSYNDRFAMVQLPATVNDEYSFVIFFADVFKEGDSATLFDTLYIPAEWGNEQLSEFAEFELTVTAFGVQASGIADCVTAMISAFPEHISL